MRRYALIGNPLGHSLSPQIHGLISEVTGTPCEYRLMPMAADAVGPFLRSLPGSGIAGVNVTIPHKQLAAQNVDELSPEARVLGAINTIQVTESGTTGHNTDVHGFRAMLASAGIAVAGKRCVILGAGGSARAVSAALQAEGAAEILVVSRDPGKVTAPFPGAKLIAYSELLGVPGNALVNCTPVGMHPQTGQSPVPKDVAWHFGAVVDLIYNPKETLLLQYASEAGLPHVNGLYMLVAQAVRARAIWEGEAFGAAVERAVYERMSAALEGNP